MENWFLIKKSDDAYLRIVLSYFRAWPFSPALYMIKGKKARENQCNFLCSIFQLDYNTNLAGPWKTGLVFFFENQFLHITFAWNTVLIFRMKEMNGGAQTALYTSQDHCMGKWLHLSYPRAILNTTYNLQTISTRGLPTCCFHWE